MCVSYVNKIDSMKVKEKNRTYTELHTFYRLSFIYFQGLCSTELDEEEEEQAERKKKKEKDSQTLLIFNDT